MGLPVHDRMWLVVVAFAAVAGLGSADTPAECMYEDIRGTWTFVETARDGDNTIDCGTDEDLGFDAFTTTITLDFPNIATDDLGNTGTWTMIYNQGFEVNINDRSYFAFSYYEGGFGSATSYCDQIFNGWSRDTSVNNWSCYQGQKNTKVTPRVSSKVKNPLPDRKFTNNEEFINKINSAQSSWTAKAYPEFEKYTLSEMYARAGGPASVILNPPSPAPASAELKAKVSELPENFDWTDVNGVNYVTPVRDQASCGSCYAFASMATIEAKLKIATDNARDEVFSPQDVVECSVLAQGCMGGFNYLIAGRMAMEQGVVPESCNTYTGRDGSCSTDMSCDRTYVSSYEYLGGYYGACNEELMMQALVDNGPLAVSFMVYSDFYGYGGGIYHHTGFRDEYNPFEMTSHAVTLVGYGVDPSTGEKFWNVKNSWGKFWGEHGYFRIRRGTNDCSIESITVDVAVVA